MSDSPKHSILVVEDDPTWQELYEEILEDEYELTFAGTYQEAIDALDSGEFDLAIVDPGLDSHDDSNRDGIKIVRRISALGLPTSVIVITADKDRLRRDDPSLNGFADDIIDVIEKSASLTEITEVVKEAIEAKTKEPVKNVLREKRAHDQWRRLGRRTTGRTVYQAFEQILEQLQQLADADVAHFLFPTDGGDELEIIVDTGHDEGRRFEISDSITGKAYRTGESINLGDTSLNPEYKFVHMLEEKQRMNSELAVPVKRNGDKVGVLNVESQRFHAFGEWHEKLMATFANLAVSMAQSEQRQNELVQIRLTARDLLESVLEPTKIWNSILERGLDLIDAKIGFLAIKANDGLFYIVAATEDRHRGQLLDVDSSTAGLAVKSGLPHHAEGVLAVPLQLGTEIVGVLDFESDRPRRFTDDGERLILFLADYASIAIRLARQAKHLHELEGQKKQSALAAKLVHSVGNPIRNIRDWLKEIEQDDITELKRQFPSVDLVVSHVERNVDQLMKVVKRLKKSLQELTLKPRPTGVNACIKFALEELSVSGKGTEIKIELDLAPELPMAYADESLKDIFVELFENSIEAMPSGGTIRVGTRFRDGRIRAWVADTGKGISSRVLPHIFDPGFSKKKRATEVDGLGLSWCRQYIESCGGNIDPPESEPGKGTTITIVLPVYSDKLRSSTFLE